MGEDVEEVVDDISADIAAAIEELKEPEVNEPERDDSGKFATKEPEATTEAVEPKPEAPEAPAAPQSWGQSVKGEWSKLPEAVRSEILKRENDIHQAMTRHDGDLRLGREMKDVITPYMAQIQAEGGTAATAVSSLLNTAHILRTGSDEQKRNVILTTAKQFGVDLGVAEEEYVDPTIQQLKREIEQLKQVANPQAMESILRERLESDKVKSEIDAFASDSANVHFQTVRPLMVAMLNAGQAKDLKEAYDMACMANPTIRSTLEAARTAEQQAKRKQEVEAKKRAASSITGSPAVTSNSKVNNQKSSPSDDIRAVWEELESRI